MTQPLKRTASIDDLRQVAHQRVPKPFMEYVESGSFGELTLRENRRALDAIEFRSSVMGDASIRRLNSTMLGENVAMPVALAPVGLCGAVRANGEILACQAAQDFGVPFVLSTNALLSIEDVARAVRRPFWFQLYLSRDRGFSLSLIDRAQQAGCSALVLTMDVPVQGIRYADVHNGLGGPPALTAANLWSIVRHPGWAFRMAGSKRWSFGNYAGRIGSSNLREMAKLVEEQLDPSVNAASIEWVRRQWKGKLIVKGIMEAEDATAAVEHGADAIVVSNHGGRQLDGVPSTVEALPPIVEAIEDQAEIFVDSGVRSGLDVLKFLALGASACFIGRAYLYGLGAFGQAGVTKALTILRDELDVGMALTGATDCRSIPRDIIETMPGKSSSFHRTKRPNSRWTGGSASAANIERDFPVIME